jgi:quercetin dioxygenase-like cupin family protein
MKLFTKAPDGGKGSGVTGYFLIEAKSKFSIVLLRFNKGTREAYHSHGFNALTLWLAGSVKEHLLGIRAPRHFNPLQIKWTPRNAFHKIEALETSWAMSIRGPWVDRWQEYRNGQFVTLTHGRQEIE